MSSSFTALVGNIPCEITLDSDYNIKEITTNKGQWVVELSPEKIDALEEQYDYLIASIKKEDEAESREYTEHVRRELQIVRKL